MPRRNFHNIAAVRDAARRRLPLPVWDFLEGGAEDEYTLRRNTAAFDLFHLNPRTLLDVSNIDLTTRVLGQSVSMPLMLAPTGASGLWRPAGEAAAARAAAEAGIFYGLSTGSTLSLEDVASVGAGPRMFQLYAFKDQSINEALIERSRDAGFQALCLTIDAAAGAGNRERDTRNGMSPGQRMSLRSLASIALHPSWAFGAWLGGGTRLGSIESLMPKGPHSLQDVRAFLMKEMTTSMTWKDAEKIAASWHGPFAVKGAMSVEDARNAVAIGANAIIVSNHGGRQLDGVSSTIEALPAILDEVGDAAEVILDSGVRRGSHIVKALALGAKAVMVGRPYLYGLAANGEDGVRTVIDIFRAELKKTMALAGATRIDELDASFVHPAMASREARL
ncbi:MAG: alpha-hydroxy acid oxidase [Pseudomonadota bacterium]